MRNVLAISERELRSYFVSPLAYVVIALFLALSGYLFGLITTTNRQATLGPLLSNISVLLLFIIPAISMRLLAEEQRSGTIEVLLTNPVQEWEVVLGKFLASMGLVLVIFALTLLYPLFLFLYGRPDPGPMITGYLGIILQAGAFLAIGLFASSLTQNQIVAAILTFGMLLLFWLSDAFGAWLGGTLGDVIIYLSIINHFNDFSRGVINSKDVIYYLTVIVAGLVLSTIALQSRRLR